MESALNATFEVLTFGAVVVLVVLGLGIIAGMMGIFNFAHGEFVLLGAYTTYLVYSFGAPVWLSMLAAPLVVAAIGFVLERLVIRRFYAAPVAAMLGTYALGLIIREGVRSLIGSVPEPIVGSLAVGDVQRSRWRCAIVVITARGDDRQLPAANPDLLWAARPRGTRESVSRPRVRHLNQRSSMPSLLRSARPSPASLAHW
jgi:branched-chain amino acid transport system permease protein|nr:branched-chain amino acid ABC transporter permease [Bradyrhizobium erythrophlei]